jgi:hypothetical protein
MRYLLICLLLISFLSCKKENDEFITGTVIEAGGCFGDSFLVAIDNPDLSEHSFLRPAVICPACYNCSNAVFISLSSSLRNPGARIKFLYTELQVSCLSYSEAPNHITVRKLSRL